MGRGIDERTYYPCLKCDVWVPHYAKEIHSVECHELRLNQFSHPYCKGCHLYAHIKIIENNEEEEGNSSKRKESKKFGSESKSFGNDSRKESKRSENESKSFGSDSKKSHKTNKVSVSSEENYKHKLCQPEWLKKIFPSFHYRLVLVNESDLIRNDIIAYSPVVLKYKSNEVAFLAVPEETIKVGQIALHATGVDLYLPSLEKESLIELHKMSDIQNASHVYLKPDQSLKSSMSSFLQNHLHSLLLRGTGSLGLPFVLKVGSQIFLKPDKFALSFSVSGRKLIEESMHYVKDNCASLHITDDSVFGSEQGTSSEYITLDQCGSRDSANISEDIRNLPEIIDGMSKLNLSSSESGGYITIDEYCEGDSKNDLSLNDDSKQLSHDNNISSIGINVITSTPRKRSSKGSKDNNSLYKSTLTGKCREQLISSINFEDNIDPSKIPHLDNWFIIKSSTEIIIEDNRCEIKSEKQLKNIMDNSRETYCEDESYLQLIKIIQKKIKEFDHSGDPLFYGWSGVLLSGPPGIGKTLMVTSLANKLGLPLFKLTMEETTNAKQDKDQWIEKLFKQAIERAPSLIFLDDIDCLCPNEDQTGKRRSGITEAVIKGFHCIQSASVPVVVLAASSFSDRISRNLCRSGYFDKEIIIILPDVAQRKQILSHILHSHKHHLKDCEISELAAKAYGFTGADLNVLIRCSWVNCVSRYKKDDKTVIENLFLNKNDLDMGIKSVVPTVLRHNYTTVSKVKWSEIYGYSNTKTKLHKMLELHSNNPTKHPLKGLLLYGPPGCSKTMFVRAMVHETGFSFFPLKCSDLLSKYVGETEKALSKVFNRAKQAAPSIIFMDEIDSLCSQRGGGGGGGLVSELLSLTTLLTSSGNVMLVGATNRPAVIDEALLRPGCLEQILHIDLPDTATREEMWRGMCHGVPMTGTIDYQHLALLTQGFSGAEIVGIYQVTANKALSSLDMGKIAVTSADDYIDNDNDNLSINQEMILEALKSNPSRTPHSLLNAIDQFTRQRSTLIV